MGGVFSGSDVRCDNALRRSSEKPKKKAVQALKLPFEPAGFRGVIL